MLSNSLRDAKLTTDALQMFWRLQEVGKSEAKHFLILFRDHGQQFRAIYSFNPDTEEIIKISGNGPKAVSNGMVERFYKYVVAYMDSLSFRYFCKC